MVEVKQEQTACDGWQVMDVLKNGKNGRLMPRSCLSIPQVVFLEEPNRRDAGGAASGRPWHSRG